MVAFFSQDIHPTSRTGLGIPTNNIDLGPIKGVSAGRQRGRGAGPDTSASPSAAQRPAGGPSINPDLGAGSGGAAQRSAPSRAAYGRPVVAFAGGPAANPSARGGSAGISGAPNLQAYLGRNAASANVSGPAMTPG